MKIIIFNPEFNDKKQIEFAKFKKMKKMKKITFAVATLLFTAMALNAQVATKVIKLEGTITAQFTETNPKESVTNLTDGDVSTKYFVSQKTALWIQYEAPTAMVVNQYTIASGNDRPDRDPKNWILKASKDGITWVDMDVQNDQVFPARKTERTFNVANKTAYKFYRLDVTSNNGGVSGTQFSEWSLMNSK